MTRNNFSSSSLPPPFAEDLANLNPHWSGRPGPKVPAFRRGIFDRLRRLIHNGLTPAIVLRGPRRVGKTVLLRQLMEALLAEGVGPQRILHAPFDEIQALRHTVDPIQAIGRWFEQNVLGRTLNESARAGETAYLLLDEVQNLDSWAPQIKHLVDNNDVRVLVTGSSSLRIEAGRDSLAGRITTLEIGPLLLREIAGLRSGQTVDPFWKENGADSLSDPEFWRAAAVHSRDQADLRIPAFQAFSDRGAYPIAHERKDEAWPEIADYLNETVIRRAIQHDLRMGPRGAKRDETLLEEVFRLACRYAGQAPGRDPGSESPPLSGAGGPLESGRESPPLSGVGGQPNVGWQRVFSYLKFLDGTLLIRLIRPLELRLKKQKSASKLCLCDHALRASWLQEIVPLTPADLAAAPRGADLAGHIAESVLGYFFASVPTLDVSWFPQRGAEPEVDFVLTVGLRRIPIEVKDRRRIDSFDDSRGLRAFLEKTVYNAPFGLLVTLEDDVVVTDPRIIPISLSSLLWLR
ncbi:MAG TPA: AAA family ATPase [Armatimonadota bacterium]|nr:AAA family ATPase [Armatimonadota bacterium]